MLREQEKKEIKEKQKELEILKKGVQNNIQTKLNLGEKLDVIKPSNISVNGGQITLSQAEKEKFRKKLILNSQMSIFKELYPELVEKNQIKYPIDDKLVKKMPDLHGAHMIRDPPNFKKVIICNQEFEDLLYIWEFFNNFSDFLEIPMFNLEEL